MLNKLYTRKAEISIYIPIPLTSSPSPHRLKSHPRNRDKYACSSLHTLRIVLISRRTRTPRRTNSRSRPPTPTTLSILRHYRPSRRRRRRRTRLQCRASLRRRPYHSCRTRFRSHNCRTSRRRPSTTNRLSTPHRWARNGIIMEIRIDIHGIAWFITFDKARDRNEWAGGTGTTACNGDLCAGDVELRNTSWIGVMDS